MPNDCILADRVGKKFHRTFPDAILGKLQGLARKALHLKPRETLGRGEFWALRDVSFTVKQGECLGVIGPNGAGKSTLLKLIHREYRPDSGRILSLGAVKPLIRIGVGLHPLLSGRENIYLECQQMGLGKRETDARLAGIVAFAGLEEAIDAPVKTYSDGMYARLEFSIATSVQADILLVDEVLSVGDIAFQIRALDRLNQLKRDGSAIVFVSHSEMNVRHVADRCLLLFDGRQVAVGEPDALFSKYYESIGYLNNRLRPLGVMLRPPEDIGGELTVGCLRLSGVMGDAQVRPGESLEMVLAYVAKSEVPATEVCLHFWNLASVLVASADSGLAKTPFRLQAGAGKIEIRIPFVSLTPGHYQVAAGFKLGARWLAYQSCLLDLYVTQDGMATYNGLTMLEASFFAHGDPA